MKPRSLALLSCLAACGPAASPPAGEREVYVAPSAPEDRPVAVHDSAMVAFFARLEPRVQRARASYPDALERFRRGLPAGSSFFVTTRLRDDRGRVEQVFVAVDRVVEGGISGRLWSDIGMVQGYRKGMVLTVRDTDVVDWTITRPDGSEDGNHVGKYIDSMQAGTAP